jgi:hypothetical protein
MKRKVSRIICEARSRCARAILHQKFCFTCAKWEQRCIHRRSPSSGQGSWLQIRRSGFDSRRYKIFWVVVGLELSLVSTNEELFGRNSGSGLEKREYCRRDPLCWPRNTLYPQKLALTSSTSGSRSVGRVRLWTKATEFFLSLKEQML